MDAIERMSQEAQDFGNTPLYRAKRANAYSTGEA
jgi:hypothetical protein